MSDCLQHMRNDIESMNRDRGKCQTAYNTLNLWTGTGVNDRLVTSHEIKNLVTMTVYSGWVWNGSISFFIHYHLEHSHSSNYKQTGNHWYWGTGRAGIINKWYTCVGGIPLVWVFTIHVLVMNSFFIITSSCCPFHSKYLDASWINIVW